MPTNADGLSARARNVLWREHLKTLGALADFLTHKTLAGLEWCGVKTEAEILLFLENEKQRIEAPQPEPSTESTPPLPESWGSAPANPETHKTEARRNRISNEPSLAEDLFVSIIEGKFSTTNDLLEHIDKFPIAGSRPEDASQKPISQVAIELYFQNLLKQALTPRKAEIFSLYYGLFNGESSTLATIGERVGLSRERIRQIINQCRRKLSYVRVTAVIRMFLDLTISPTEPEWAERLIVFCKKHFPSAKDSYGKADFLICFLFKANDDARDVLRGVTKQNKLENSANYKIANSPATESLPDTQVEPISNNNSENITTPPLRTVMLPTKHVKFTDQWRHFKEQCPGHLLLIQCGCYYNVLLEDAELCKTELNWKTYYWGETLTSGIPVSTNNLARVFSKKKIPFAVIQEVKVDGHVVGREITECRNAKGEKVSVDQGARIELPQNSNIPTPTPPSDYSVTADKSSSSEETETTITSAIDMLQALHANANPLTGEVFEDSFMLCDPKIKEAVGLALKSLEHYKKFLKRKSRLPAKAGEGWSSEEDRQLFDAYEKGKSVKELATVHQRTQGAIKSRLMQSGKWDQNR